MLTVCSLDNCHLDFEETMKKIFLVLANSIRRGGHCIAGREMFQRDDKWSYGPWVRPVSQHGEGEVRTGECLCSDGNQPAVLDIVEVPLTGKQDCAHQPENYLIDPTVRWLRVGTIQGNSLGVIEETPPDLWLQYGQRTDTIHTAAVLAAPSPFQSIYLVRPNNLRFRIWEAFDRFHNYPRKNRRAIFTYAGTEYDLPITDPTMEARYFRPFPTHDQPPQEIVPTNPSNCLLVVSLTVPLDDYHYKVVASILET